MNLAVISRDGCWMPIRDGLPEPGVAGSEPVFWIAGRAEPPAAACGCRRVSDKGLAAALGSGWGGGRAWRRACSRATRSVSFRIERSRRNKVRIVAALGCSRFVSQADLLHPQDNHQVSRLDSLADLSITVTQDAWDADIDGLGSVTRDWLALAVGTLDLLAQFVLDEVRFSLGDSWRAARGLS